LNEEQKQYNGAKVVLSTKGPGTTGYPYAKK